MAARKGAEGEHDLLLAGACRLRVGRGAAGQPDGRAAETSRCGAGTYHLMPHHTPHRTTHYSGSRRCLGAREHFCPFQRCAHLSVARRGTAAQQHIPAQHGTARHSTCTAQRTATHPCLDCVGRAIDKLGLHELCVVAFAVYGLSGHWRDRQGNPVALAIGDSTAKVAGNLSRFGCFATGGRLRA